MMVGFVRQGIRDITTRAVGETPSARSYNIAKIRIT